jgi:geranylgeranyl transferase type-1 subunit beta
MSFEGGPTFCAVACLSLCPDRLEPEPNAIADARLVRWLVRRQISGFQGRTNKIADACYSFWCGGALQVRQ